MARFAVAVNDLHLGRGNEQDDFSADEMFARFCNDIAGFCQNAGHELTFVLNGDIIDYWEIAPDEELRMDAANRIAETIIYPADTPTERSHAVRRAAWQSRQALGAHPLFVGGLQRIAALPGSRIHYNIGNHDHIMAADEVQQDFRQALASAGLPFAESDQFTFGHYLLDLELSAYFEHGHQCRDTESNYADVADPWIEAPGYFFLRFVWNRLQALYRYRDKLSDQLRIALQLAFDPQSQASRDSLQCFYDYFLARRTLRFPLVRGPMGVVARLYEIWESAGTPPDPQPDLNALLRQEFSQASLTTVGEDAELRLDRAHLTEPPQALPGRAKLLGVDRDEYRPGLRRRFSQASAPFPRLPGNLKVAFLGHTHRELYGYVKDEIGQAPTRYINGGCWTRGTSRLAYGWVQPGDNARRTVGLMYYN